jgi:hypothetical protein
MCDTLKNTIGKISLISSQKESCAGTALFCVATEVKRKKMRFVCVLILKRKMK